MTFTKVYTLAFIKRNDAVLLGLKTRGLGEGFWNGFGGKVEKKETVHQAAVREIKEECNLNVKQLTHLGIVRYEEDGNPQASVVHIFTCSNFYGTAQASEEMNPLKWYPFTNIPYDNMWADAKVWHPYMLAEKFFYGLVHYNSEGQIVDNVIREFDSIDKVLQYSDV